MEIASQLHVRTLDPPNLPIYVCGVIDTIPQRNEASHHLRMVYVLSISLPGRRGHGQGCVWCLLCRRQSVDMSFREAAHLLEIRIELS